MSDFICFEEEQMIAIFSNPKTKNLIETIEKNLVFHFYPQAQVIIQTFLLPTFIRATISSNDRGMIYFLYGDYHTGKSYLLKYFAALAKKLYPHIWAPNTRPIIKIDLNNKINTSEQLLLYLLDQLGRPIEHTLFNQWKQTNLAKERLQSHLIAHLERNKTQLLILDECQRLISPKNSEILDIFELFKDLSTKTNWSGNLRTQILLCGTNDGLPLLEAADWIQGRTRSMKLCEIDGREYGMFLLKIYKYYTSIGISEEWSLVSSCGNDQKRNLNQDFALYLFGRTKGRIGLTAFLIREAILHALSEGRVYPEKNDFEAINLDALLYVVDEEHHHSPITNNPVQIHIKLQDRCCKIQNCIKSTHPYANYRSLIQHYKLKHPQVELLYGDEK